MYKLPERVLLAVRVLCGLSEDEHESNQATVKRLKCSTHTLAKIIQALARAKLIKSKRGPGGGVVLACPLSEISVMDVYQACWEEPPTSCELHRRLNHRCPVCSLVKVTSSWLRAGKLSIVGKCL